MKRTTGRQLAARRREVANLAHSGWTQAAIASHLKIPQGTVSRDLAAMREFWREFPVYDFAMVPLRGHLCAELSRICASSTAGA